MYIWSVEVDVCGRRKGNWVRIPSDPVTVFREPDPGAYASKAIAHMREKAGCRRGTISQETCFLPVGVSEAVGSAPEIEWASGKSSSRKERDRQGPFMLRVFL